MASVGTILYRSTKPGTSATSLAVICSATGLPYMILVDIRQQCSKWGNGKCGLDRQSAASATKKKRSGEGYITPGELSSSPRSGRHMLAPGGSPGWAVTMDSESRREDLSILSSPKIQNACGGLP